MGKMLQIRRCVFLWILLFGMMLFPQRVMAVEKGYFENPEEIYRRFRDRIYDEEYEVKYGFLREGKPIYRDFAGSKRIGKAAKYSGIIIVGDTGSYFQVIYETKTGYGIGWMDKEEYLYTIRFYDGAEKQLLADGEYALRSYFGESGAKVQLIFAGDQQYRIKQASSGKYLDLVRKNGRYEKKVRWAKKRDSESQHWQLIREYDHFYLKNKISGLYLIERKSKFDLAPLREDPENSFEVHVSWQGKKKAWWKIGERAGKNVKPHRNFLQYDPDWGREDYGNVSDYSGKIAAAGCGVVAITNAVYALNGQFADPMIFAELAVKMDYRIVGSGTDDGIFKAAADEFGDAYGFSYVGKTYDTFKMRDYLKKGCVAVSHVPGHYVTVADYRGKNGKYLVLDSCPITARPTTPFGDWFKRVKLETGGLASSCYFIYGVKEG